MSAAVTLHLTLPAWEAWALAEFVKRAGYSDYRTLAVDADEAHAMQGRSVRLQADTVTQAHCYAIRIPCFTAAERLRIALADAGYAPR